ncbi:hypothetical protein ElyMa_002533700 [Elysia marginata]|uniref:Uncharacterized protein n=1 Tax=Elysia marginata TaxID=1093978 RepID=A0AAV4GUX5_9GAST|nr:hypothetical protein ElyMa_002533700 [Elysia marginata]
MTKQAIVVGLVLVLIIVVFAYLVVLPQKKPPQEEDGMLPQVLAEAYLFYDPSMSSPSLSEAFALAKSFGAQVASPGDLAFYAAQGGSAEWYGITSSGDILAAPSPIYSPVDYVITAPCRQTPYGVWLYGPKGSVGLQNVSPFNRFSWFQPAASSVL